MLQHFTLAPDGLRVQGDATELSAGSPGPDFPKLAFVDRVMAGETVHPQLLGLQGARMAVFSGLLRYQI